LPFSIDFGRARLIVKHAALKLSSPLFGRLDLLVSPILLQNTTVAGNEMSLKMEFNRGIFLPQGACGGELGRASAIRHAAAIDD